MYDKRELVLIAIIMLLLIILNIKIHANTLTDWKLMTVEQKANIHKAYLYGKPYNLGLTLSAIATVESSGGRFRISSDYKDVGITMLNLKYYMKYHGIVDSSYNRLKWITKLIRNDKLCFSHTVTTLLYFKAKYGNYKAMVSAYNNGKRHNPIYYKKIYKWVRFYKTIFNKRK